MYQVWPKSICVSVVAIIHEGCLCFQTLIGPSVRIAGITENIYIILPYQALSYRPRSPDVRCKCYCFLNVTNCAGINTNNRDTPLLTRHTQCGIQVASADGPVVEGKCLEVGTL